MAVKPVRKSSSAQEDELILWGVKPTPASQFKVGDRVYYHVIKKVTKNGMTFDVTERKFGKVTSVGDEGIGIKTPYESSVYLRKEDAKLFAVPEGVRAVDLPKPPTPYRIMQYGKKLREQMEAPASIVPIEVLAQKETQPEPKVPPKVVAPKTEEEPSVKLSWQMTRGEYFNKNKGRYSEPDMDRQYQDSVRTAVRQGKNVPVEVLNQYPEFQKDVVQPVNIPKIEPEVGKAEQKEILKQNRDKIARIKEILDDGKKKQSIDKLESMLEELEDEEDVEGVAEIRDAIDEYRDLERSGMTPEEYNEEKQSLFERLQDSVNDLATTEDAEEPVYKLEKPDAVQSLKDTVSEINKTEVISQVAPKVNYIKNTKVLNDLAQTSYNQLIELDDGKKRQTAQTLGLRRDANIREVDAFLKSVKADIGKTQTEPVSSPAFIEARVKDMMKHGVPETTARAQVASEDKQFAKQQEEEKTTEPLKYDPMIDRYSGKKLSRGDVLTDKQGNRYTLDRANGFILSLDRKDDKGVVQTVHFSVDPTDSDAFKELLPTGENVFEKSSKVKPVEKIQENRPGDVILDEGGHVKEIIGFAPKSEPEAETKKEIKTVITPELGKSIAKQLGIKYDAIQPGFEDIPDMLQFTDPTSGSTTYGNSIEEAKTNLASLRANYTKSKSEVVVVKPSKTISQPPVVQKEAPVPPNPTQTTAEPPIINQQVLEESYKTGIEPPNLKAVITPVIQQPKVSKKITEAIDTKDEPFIKKKASPQHSGWMSKKVAKLPQVVETEVKPVKTLVTNKATGITYELTVPVGKGEIVQEVAETPKVAENVQPAKKERNKPSEQEIQKWKSMGIRDDEIDNLSKMSPELRALHLHPARIKGFNKVNDVYVEDYFAKLEDAAMKSGNEKIMTAAQNVRSHINMGDINKGDLANEEALKLIHDLYLEEELGIPKSVTIKSLFEQGAYNIQKPDKPFIPEAKPKTKEEEGEEQAYWKELDNPRRKIPEGSITQIYQKPVIKSTRVKKPAKVKKDSGSASIYDYVKENEPQSVIVQSKPPVLPRIVQQEVTDEIKKMTGGKGTLISTEPITHPESPVSRAFETLAKVPSEPKTIADMPEIQTSPYTTMKMMPPMEKVERLEPMVKTTEKFRDLSEKIKERYQKYPASAVMSEYYLRNVPTEVKQSLLVKPPEPKKEVVVPERVKLPKNLPEAIYNIQVKQPMKVIKPEPLMTTATGGLVKGVRSLGDVYPEGSQVEYSKEGKRVKGIIKGHDIDALSKKMGETTLNTLRIQNPQGEMEDVRLSQGNFKLINKPEKAEKVAESKIIEQFEKRKPKKEKLPPSVTDYAHTIRAAQKISEPAFVEPRMPKPVRMPRKLKDLPILEETEIRPPSSEFMAEVNMGKKMKKKEARQKVISRKIREKGGFVTQKLKNIPLLQKNQKEWNAERTAGKYKRKPLLDNDLTKSQVRKYLRDSGVSDQQQRGAIIDTTVKDWSGLKTVSYPTKEKIEEMRTKEQNIEAEAEARNKKAEEFVKGERERSKAETKKLTESVTGIQKSQKEQTKEEAKEAKRQAVLDTFLMGKGTYNKSIANAIKTADESRRIFAEVDRRKREKEQAVVLREQVQAQKAQQKHQAAVELAGGERQLSQAQKEMQKYAKEKFKYLRHKRKQDIERWKVRERPAVVRWATTRKKGKLGTSRVGNVIHSILYPVKPRKKRRW